MLLASVLVSMSGLADEPLRASLDFSIRSQPYNNSFPIPIVGPKIVIDRDPASPFYGTIYAMNLVGGTGCVYPPTGLLQIARSVDGGQTFDTPAVVPICLVLPYDAAVGRDGNMFVVSAIGIFRSADGGQSWNLVRELGAQSIATDNATGKIYVGWRDPYPYNGKIRISSSGDGGSTWSPPANVSDYPGSGPPQIAAYRSSVVVAFVGAERPSYGGEYYPVVTAAASQDGGLTWPNITALAKGGSYLSPSVDVSPLGVFAISWWEVVFYNNDSTLLTVSSDGGRTWSTPVQPGGIQGQGNGLAFDDASRLYVTWRSTRDEPLSDNSSSIYVAVSPDYGNHFENASFTVSVAGCDANQTYLQRLAAGPRDTMFLTWGGRCELDPHIRTVSGQGVGEIALASSLGDQGPVELVLKDQRTATVKTRVPWNGSSIIIDELPPSVYDVWVDVGVASALAGAMPLRPWNTTAFTVRVEGGPSGPGPSPFPWLTAAAVGGVVLVASAALLALQHTRLAREDILQRKVRLLIYETVREHPGYSFTEIRDAIGLKNGVAAYHLGVLEKQGLIHSEKGRRHRWYYPNGDVSLWRDLPLSPLQRAILEKVRSTSGIAIRELARYLNRRHGSVAYNVKGLAREGLVRTQRTGRKVQCFPADQSGTT